MNRFKFLSILVVMMASLSCTTPDALAQRTEFYGQRKSLFEILPVDTTSIVFLGNSLTNGCEWHELFGNPNIKNRGINGDTVDGIIERLDPVVAGKPAKIFLLSGVNDISHDLSADSIVTMLMDLVDRIHAATPSTRLYVESLLPINNSFGRYRLLKDKEPVIKEINCQLAANAGEKGYTWIDCTSTFADADGNLDASITNDGLHLLGPAYLRWRDLLAPYVAE